jgi:hypothetical protein
MKIMDSRGKGRCQYCRCPRRSQRCHHPGVHPGGQELWR